MKLGPHLSELPWRPEALRAMPCAEHAAALAAISKRVAWFGGVSS